MRRVFLATAFLLIWVSVASAQICLNCGGGSGGGGGAPSGPAGGALSGTYPNPGLGIATGTGGTLTSAAGSDSVVNVKNYGAKGDGKIVYDAAMANGTPASESSANTAASAPAFTTTAANDLVFSVFSFIGSMSVVPVGPTQIANVAAVGGQNMGFWAGYTLKATPGTVAAVTGTVSVNGWAGITLPIMPVSGTITVGNVTTGTAAGTANTTINVPAATANGDLLLHCLAWYPNNSTDKAIINAGWTFLAFISPASGGSNASLTCSTRTASSEPASYTFATTASGDSGGGFIVDLKNASTVIDNPLTSASATFTAGDAGKLECVDRGVLVYKTAGAATDQCGTISSFVNSTTVYLSKPNSSNAAIGQTVAITAASQSSFTATFTTGARSPEVMVVGNPVTIVGVTPSGYNGTWVIASVPGNTSFTATLSVSGLGAGSVFGTAQPAIELDYATNDATALQAAVNALPQGGTVWVPTGMYGTNASLAIPATVTVNLLGSGWGATRWDYLLNQAYMGTQATTALLFLTKSLTGAGLQYIATAGFDGNLTSQNTNDTVKDILLQAGAGFNYDGGGNDGIDIVNFTRVKVDHVGVVGFLQDGVLINGGAVGASAVSYTVNVEVRNSYIELNGRYGVHVGPTNFNEVPLIQNNEIESNFSHGVYIEGPQATGIQLIGNTVQWDNVGATAGGCEINVIAPSYSGVILSNHVEINRTNTNGICDAAAAAAVDGFTIQDNFVNDDISSGSTAFVLGTSASFPYKTGIVSNNTVNTTTMTCFARSSTGSVGMGNVCNGATYAWNDGQVSSGPTAASAVGTAGVFAATEGTAPTATTAVDELWADATSHTWKMNGNAGSQQWVLAAATQGGATGTFLYGQGATTTPIWSTLVMPNAATQGDILDATSSNTVGSLADVAVGRVLTSGGVGAVPAYSATPTLGVGGTTSGTLNLANATGAGLFSLAATANTTAYTLSMPAAAPGTSGQVLSSTTAGAATWIATESEINAGSNTYGNNTPFPTGVPIVQKVATNAGHFTQLTSTNITLNAGSCTTAPTFNVFDGASNLGTAKIASATVQAKGTATTQTETLTFAAGDVIGIIVSTQGATCLAPIFNVDATVVYP